MQNWTKGETWKFYLFMCTYVKDTSICIICINPLNLKDEEQVPKIKAQLKKFVSSELLLKSFFFFFPYSLIFVKVRFSAEEKHL